MRRRGLLPLASITAATFLTLAVFSAPAAEKTAAYRAAVDAINVDEQFQHVEILASPAMEGRRPGTPGGDKAADYLAKHFAKCGLKPAGADGTYLQPFDAKGITSMQNVLAILPGSDPKLRDEVIVVGGHYDTFGHGGGKLPKGPLYPGAEDNASGTATVLQLAKALSKLSPAPKRSILFACWDAEEWRLLGSTHFVTHPTVPRERIVAALNFDMVGQMTEDELFLHCTRSGAGWRRLLSEANQGEQPLRLNFTWDFAKNSDHYAFAQHDIPVVFAITGARGFVHSPRDTADQVKRESLFRVSRWSLNALYDLANRVDVPKFRPGALKESSATEKEMYARSARPGERVGIAVIDPPQSDEGVRVVLVKAGTPAAQAGLHTNDEIIGFNDRDIRNPEELLGAVYTASNPAAMLVKRPGSEQPVELQVRLQGSPIHWTVAGETDDAEPGTVVLTYILPGSPAARSGLRVGDRIYRINGQNFADESDLIAKMRLRPARLTVEREGRLRTVTLPSKATPVKKAA